MSGDYLQKIFGNSGGSEPQTTYTPDGPPMVTGGGNVVPGQLGILSQQLSQGGYGTPQGILAQMQDVYTPASPTDEYEWFYRITNPDGFKTSGGSKKKKNNKSDDDNSNRRRRDNDENTGGRY